MTLIIRDTGGTPRTITEIQVRDSTNTPRDISEIRVRTSNNTSKVVFVVGGGTPMTASASPTSIANVSWGSGTVTTNATTATPSGGTPPYTYLWTLIDHSNATPPTINTSTAASTTVTQTGVVEDDSATIRCTVTDATSQTAQTEIVSAFFINSVPPTP